MPETKVEMSYGFGLYRRDGSCGIWFGFGQLNFCPWMIDLCLLKLPSGHYKHWFTVGWRDE